MARVKPVLTGSMKTKSDSSSSDSLLLTSRKGGGGKLAVFLERNAFGPSRPRCSQTEEEPGPPLKEKETGRPAALVASSRV